jgi:hypothetical protein
MKELLFKKWMKKAGDRGCAMPFPCGCRDGPTPIEAVHRQTQRLETRGSSLLALNTYEC